MTSCSLLAQNIAWMLHICYHITVVCLFFLIHMLIYLCGCLMLVSFKSFEFCLYRSLCTNWLVDNFVQISHLNTMENVFNIYDYNLKILFHLVCCKWLILCGTKKLIFLIFSYFSTNHILFKWLSLLKLYTLNCENVDTKKSINNGQWDLTAFMVRCTW